MYISEMIKLTNISIEMHITRTHTHHKRIRKNIKPNEKSKQRN